MSEESSLAEIWRILRPGGMLFIWDLPRRWGSVELLNSALHRSRHDYKYHRADVFRLVEGAGFEIKPCSTSTSSLNLSSRNALGRVVGHVNAWTWDYYLSKVLFGGAFCQWFTVIARKPKRHDVSRSDPQFAEDRSQTVPPGPVDRLFGVGGQGFLGSGGQPLAKLGVAEQCDDGVSELRGVTLSNQGGLAVDETQRFVGERGQHARPAGADGVEQLALDARTEYDRTQDDRGVAQRVGQVGDIGLAG